QGAGTDFRKRTGPGGAAARIRNNTDHLGRKIVAADAQRIAAADEIVAGAGDGACADFPVGVRAPAAGEVDDAAGLGFETRGAAIAAVEEECRAVVTRGDECVSGGALIEKGHTDG